MDFSWTDEQLAYKKAVVTFAQNELNHGIVERDYLGEFPRELWLKCANFGIHGLTFPGKIWWFRSRYSYCHVDYGRSWLWMS